MSLPSGYTRVEYIESSGTQYVDTGIKPDNNTKVEIRVQCAQTSAAAFFGGATTYPQNAFECFVSGAVYGNTSYLTVALYSNDFVNIIMDSDGLYKDGTKAVSFNAATFTSPNNLVLFARNRNDGVAEYMTGKIAFCKIYDNNILVRDYIPCKNASGTVGLWDDVNSQFYQNAGTGTFTAGPVVLGSHKTMIGGTIYDVTAGKCMVGGTVYDIQKGLTMVGGTIYEIPFAPKGTPVGNLAVGTIVKTPVNGTVREFIVVHQGLPSSIYNGNCNGTWLLMKDIYESRQWHSTQSITYASSDICSYLNSTFYNLFNADIKAQIKQVTIRASYGAVSGVSDLSTKIFLLSGCEVGYTQEYAGIPIDGEKLSYFDSGYGTTANNKRIAYLNGSATRWWLRSPNTYNYSNYAWLVDYNGNFNQDNFVNLAGVRPAFILPQSALVDENMNILA